MKLSEQFIAGGYECCTFDKHIPAPYMRKKFNMDFLPKKAELSICGLGFYELYINGKNITKGHLAPYISNTEDVCYYDIYDVSELLSLGENVIAIHLGNGFRNPFGGYVWEFDKSSCIGPVCAAIYFCAQKNDVVFEFEADESFKVHNSPVIFDEYRLGYQYDSNLEIDGWNEIGFDDSSWNNAIIITKPRGVKKICEAEPVKIIKTIKAVSITHYDSLPLIYDKIDYDAVPYEDSIKKDIYVYDFGVNTAGVTKIKINGKKGQKIIVRHGEFVFADKHFLNTVTQLPRNEIKKYMDYFQTDIFICKGGEEEFIPKFKYDGFRYAYVEGLTQEQATNEAVVLLETHSDVAQKANFICSDDTLNKLQENILRADLSNLHYVITDCPHREKNGWTGDVSLSAEQMLINFGVENTMKEWLVNVRYAQREDGMLPGIVPTGGWGFGWGRGPAWDSVCVNLPYYVYKYTGDKNVVIDNSSMIIRNLKYLYSTKNDKGLIEYGLGDWMQPDFKPSVGFKAPKIFTNSVFVFDMAQKAKELFLQVGLEAEAMFAKEIATQMRRAIRNELIDFDTYTVIGNCQTSQAMAIAMNVFDNDELNSACNKLVEIIHNDNDVSVCGILGMRYLFHALKIADEIDLAYKIIISQANTCYGSWIKQGETAMRESFSYPPTDSHNHHMFGDISSFFIQEFAGIKPNKNLESVYKFEISPSFISELEFVEAYYDSVCGKVYVNWKRNDEGIILNVNLPKGIDAILVVPKNYAIVSSLNDNKYLTSGNNQYTIKHI